VERASPIGLLQRLWVGFAAGIAAITAVAVVGGEGASDLPAALPVTLAVAAVGGAVIGVLAVDHTFAAAPPADDAAALAELRSRAFLQVAIAEAPVLLAFALAFVFGPPWVAVVGGVGGVLALALARPTRTRIARIEAAWRDAGRDVSALRADQAGVRSG
jgi:hypothetical protein